MTKKEKLWKKAQKSPQNLTFDEFVTLLGQTGWTLKAYSRHRCKIGHDVK